MAETNPNKISQTSLKKQLNNLNKCPECKSSSFKETLEIIK